MSRRGNIAVDVMTISDNDEAAVGLVRRIYEWVGQVRANLARRAEPLPIGIPAVHIDLTGPTSMVLTIDDGNGVQDFAESHALDDELLAFVDTLIKRGLAELLEDVRRHVDDLVESGSAFFSLGLLLGQPAGNVLTCLLISTTEPNADAVVFRVVPSVVTH